MLDALARSRYASLLQWGTKFYFRFSHISVWISLTHFPKVITALKRERLIIFYGQADSRMYILPEVEYETEASVSFSEFSHNIVFYTLKYIETKKIFQKL